MFNSNVYKKIPKKITSKVNLKIFKVFLKIFPFFKFRFKGFYANFIFKKKYILPYLKVLKYNSSFMFNYLSDISIIDFPWKKNRFHIYYILRSLNFNRIIFVNLKTPAYNSIYSISNIYKSSSWIERECWDLFGVFFYLHKNLKRILTDYGFKGHPLRKDFPLMGYKEIYFNIFNYHVSYRKIKDD